MGFDLSEALMARQLEGHALHSRHLNPQTPRVLRAIGFDKVYEKGEGSYLYDTDGRRYLDFLAGFGVFGVGRNHPVVRNTLHEILDRQLADMVQMDVPLLAGLLAERLLARAPGLGRAYFCNSGTEAVETALKFARRATGRPRVVYCHHAYHGLTVGALSVNGSQEFRHGFGPLLADTAIAFGDLEALGTELRKGDVAAFLIEPIQGKGVFVPPAGFLAEAQALLREHGSLLICDEVQTGIGRTGRFFAHQHEGVDPDIVTVAKALSGGFVPIGATLARDWIFKKVYSSMDKMLVHDSTFGGNAMAMAAGLATLAVLDEEGLVEKAARTGQILADRLGALARQYELLSEVRGRGLIIGLEFDRPQSLRLRGSWGALHRARDGLFAQVVVGTLFQRHRVLTQVAGDHMEVIKLLPSLVIDEPEIDLFMDAFTEVMEAAHRGSGLLTDLGRGLVRQAVHPARHPGGP